MHAEAAPGHDVWLLGTPLGHSVSPALHAAAAAGLGLALRYSLHEVAAASLAGAVAAVRDPAFLGANVTLPHKQAVVPLLDGISPLAYRIGAVNTIYKREGRLLGENTDAPALARCLRLQLGMTPGKDRALLFGTGGAARAAAVVLLDLGLESLTIWSRTSGHAAALVAELRARREWTAPIRVCRGVTRSLAACTLAINATTVGLDDLSAVFDPAALGSTARVFDLVYGPNGTPLTRACERQATPAADGLWMLVRQAAASFALWTGQEPAEQPMYMAAWAALTARAVRADSKSAG
jgi:shikimate dehydrogenase